MVGVHKGPLLEVKSLPRKKWRGILAACRQNGCGALLCTHAMPLSTPRPEQNLDQRAQGWSASAVSGDPSTALSATAKATNQMVQTLVPTLHVTWCCTFPGAVKSNTAHAQGARNAAHQLQTCARPLLTAVLKT